MHLHVRPDGTVETLAEPACRALIRDVAAGSPVSTRRASRVEPVHALPRALFTVLRSLAPDHGPMARWTRSWHCRWRVRPLIPGAPVLGPFADRADAIRAEIAWLERHDSLWHLISNQHP